MRRRATRMLLILNMAVAGRGEVKWKPGGGRRGRGAAARGNLLLAHIYIKRGRRGLFYAYTSVK